MVNWIDKFEATESSYWVVKSILEYNYKHCQWFTTLILVLTEIIYLIKEKNLCLKWIQIKTDEISFGLLHSWENDKKQFC